MANNFSTLNFNTPLNPGRTEQNKKEKIKYWKDKIHDLTEKKKQRDNANKAETKTSGVNLPPEPLPEEKKILEKKGIEEHTKNKATKRLEDRELLDQLIKSSNRCVIAISSLFPWDFIPNSINVEESRVTFIFRQLFTQQSHSVDIQDISNVFIEHSFFTSSLQIVSKSYIENDIKIECLKKEEAVQARMIIEGLRTLAGHNIDTSSFSVAELISKIEEMNASQGEVTSE